MFLVEVSFGTPSKPQNLIMDTGSDVTWIQCKPCKPCFPQKENFFDPTKSSTYKEDPMSLSQAWLCNKNHAAYYLYLNDISIGHQRMAFPLGLFAMQRDGSGGTIIDSGSAVGYMHPDAYKKIRDVLPNADRITTLGAWQQHNTRFVYDVANSYLMFAAEDCSKNP
ncbi:hypothetical protein AAC387_Pa03g2282 [Persea americana]